MMFDMGFAVKPVMAIDAKGYRTHSPQARNREAEAHGCGVLVGAGRDQITKVASAQSQERGKCRRLGNKTTQQSSDCETLPHDGIREHGCWKCLR